MYLLKKYFDDVIIMTSKLKLRTELRNGRLETTNEDFKEDQDSREEVTYQFFREVENQVSTFLKFTGEVAEG